MIRANDFEWAEPRGHTKVIDVALLLPGKQVIELRTQSYEIKIGPVCMSVHIWGANYQCNFAI